MKQTYTVRKTALIILDGFGLAPQNQTGNAIRPDTAPHIFSYMRKYASTELDTTGSAVGLFPNQKGNSEAGHLTIGTGRIVKQDLVRISEAIHDGTFFKNEAFKQALHHVKKYTTAVHVFGLLTDGQSAHAHPEHLYATLEYLHREDVKDVYIHLFTDGRDSPVHSAATFLHALREHLYEGQQIATIMGRYYGMDRNKTWSRTKEAYETIVSGKASYTAKTAEEAIMMAYSRGETDEYIAPTVIVGDSGHAITTVEDNDSIFFINARSDRARQLTKAFVQEDFLEKNPGAFRRIRVPKNIRFVAMTDFGPDLPGVFTAFPSPDVPNALAAAIGEAYRQLFISETEKYAHVTYFINGGYAEPINGEERELVASAPIKSYADLPGMNAPAMAERIVSVFKDDTYDFVCTNFPNADMVGHTGNFKAAEEAVRILDAAVAKIVEAVLSFGGQVMIVADHGNAEEMINTHTGEIMTEHTGNPVPCIVIGEGYAPGMVHKGGLRDVAPTLLEMLGIAIPEEMTGSSLFT